MIKFYKVRKINKLRDIQKTDVEKQFKLLSNIVMNMQAGVLICRYDEDFTIELYNSSFLKLIDYTESEIKDLLKNKYMNLLLKDDASELRKEINAQIINKGCYSIEYNINQKDGTIITVLENGNVFSGENGKLYINCMITNITEQKRTAQALEENQKLLFCRNEELISSRKRFEVAIKNSEEIIFDYLFEAGKFECTPVVAQRLRLTNNQLNGVEAIVSSGVIHPSSIAEFKEIFRRIQADTSYICTQITASFGCIRESLYEISLTKVFDEYGKSVSAIGDIRNIDKRRLLASEKKYRESLTADRLYVCEINISKGYILYKNCTWAKALGLSKVNSGIEMVEHLCSHYVHPDFIGSFAEFFNRERIISAFHIGQTQISLQYRRKNENSVYTWIESNMHIIKDDVTGELSARLYIKNINEQKEKEARIIDENRFYNAMLSKNVMVYEANISKDCIINGNEFWKNKCGLGDTKKYSITLNAIIKHSIHPDDADMVKEMMRRENMLCRYNDGNGEIYFEYRRSVNDGEYRWYSCNTNLFQDSSSNDIKAFCYVQDIDQQKTREIKLRYKAEHDGLTGFYNKVTVEKVITKFLLSEEGKSAKHAFFTFDVDCFKKLNDNFGHAFGDLILANVTQKLHELFRDDDIFGRIGGDEFVVLMKNIPNSKAARTKAQELCCLARETHIKNGAEFTVSVSVGISMFPADGSDYSTLSANSDIALYKSKENGRDCFTVFGDII